MQNVEMLKQQLKTDALDRALKMKMKIRTQNIDYDASYQNTIQNKKEEKEENETALVVIIIIGRLKCIHCVCIKCIRDVEYIVV